MSNYGAWIKPCGEVVDVPDRCTHTSYCEYGEAADEGWIAVINDSPLFGLTLRFNPETVTKAAVTKAMIMAKDVVKPILMSDMFCTSFEGYTDCGGIEPRVARQLLSALKRRTIKLKPRRY